MAPQVEVKQVVSLKCAYVMEDEPDTPCTNPAWWLVVVSESIARQLCHKHMTDEVREFAESPCDHLMVVWCDGNKL